MASMFCYAASQAHMFNSSITAKRTRLFPWIVVFLLVCSGTWAQVLKTRPPEPEKPTTPVPVKPQNTSISLTVPAGTPVKVALDQELRVRSVGQPVHGKVVEPVYAFDQLVVPAGSEVLGKIAAIDPVNKKARIMAGMDADFSPRRQVHVDFNELILPDGRHVPINVSVSPASSGVLQFVPAGEHKQSKVEQGKAKASRDLSAARQQISQEWTFAKAQLHEPGKKHKLERYAVAQLPYHPQYMDPGTSFNADLIQPLQFGSEILKPEMAMAIGTPPPAGSMVHALLVTPLSSATSKKGDPVEAVISQPLVVSDKLFIPQGSHLKGTVLEARSARRFNRSGQLRIVFHELVPPNGIQQQLEASLEGVAVSNGDRLTLDSEGGAQVTQPKTRYLTTAVSVALATSAAGDADRGQINGGGNDVGRGALNGASGFKLIGTLVGALAHSRMVSSGLGFYGAGMSVYSHFLTRGREVVYPKDMSMVVGFGKRETASAKNPDSGVHSVSFQSSKSLR
jgi:hypothetical protein